MLATDYSFSHASLGVLVSVYSLHESGWWEGSMHDGVVGWDLLLIHNYTLLLHSHHNWFTSSLCYISDYQDGSHLLLYRNTMPSFPSQRRRKLIFWKFIDCHYVHKYIYICKREEGFTEEGFTLFPTFYTIRWANSAPLLQSICFQLMLEQI